MKKQQHIFIEISFNSVVNIYGFLGAQNSHSTPAREGREIGGRNECNITEWSGMWI